MRPKASTGRSPLTGGHEHGRHPQQFRRHQIAKPVLAGLGAADRQGLQRHPRLQGGLGRRGVEDARRGRAAGRQRQRPALRRDLGRRSPPARPEQHRAHHRPRPLRESARDQAGQEGLAGPRHRRVADGALRGTGWKAILPLVEETGADGIELNFGCPHGMSERGMGVGGRPGAGIHRDGGALVQGQHPHAGDHQADAQHHRRAQAGAGGATPAAPTRCR